MPLGNKLDDFFAWCEAKNVVAAEDANSSKLTEFIKEYGVSYMSSRVLPIFDNIDISDPRVKAWVSQLEEQALQLDSAFEEYLQSSKKARNTKVAETEEINNILIGKFDVDLFITDHSDLGITVGSLSDSTSKVIDLYINKDTLEISGGF